MTLFRGRRVQAGFTLLELLCVIAIIIVLAALVLGVAGRVLKRLRNDEWGNKAEVRLQATVDQLRKHFAGQQQFPPVTLETIQAGHLVGSFELDFLKDRRVTFVPFAASDPDEKVVISVAVERGFFTDPSTETATKGSITAER